MTSLRLVKLIAGLLLVIQCTTSYAQTNNSITCDSFYVSGVYQSNGDLFMQPSGKDWMLISNRRQMHYQKFMAILINAKAKGRKVRLLHKTNLSSQSQCFAKNSVTNIKEILVIM